jgi:hypothetical protein
MFGQNKQDDSTTPVTDATATVPVDNTATSDTSLATPSYFQPTAVDTSTAPPIDTTPSMAYGTDSTPAVDTSTAPPIDTTPSMAYGTDSTPAVDNPSRKFLSQTQIDMPATSVKGRDVNSNTYTNQNDGPVDANLLAIKQEALEKLSPLVDKLDQSPEEKFHTTMMMIQASDNQSMIQTAYDAAQQITDEKERAQALLDVVNEINYFTQKTTSSEN